MDFLFLFTLRGLRQKKQKTKDIKLNLVMFQIKMLPLILMNEKETRDE